MGAMQLQAIGHLATPFKTLDACPRNGRLLDPAPVCRASVAEAFRPGLGSLAGFTHLILLYWADQVVPPSPMVFRPPFDTEQRGVFATRSPARPNPICLSVVIFDGFDGPDGLLVRYLDCLDGTPLLDIKPYLPTVDAEPAASMGWLAAHSRAR